MAAASTSETSVNFYQITRCYIPEDKSSSFSPLAMMMEEASTSETSENF
jgi:hypothetical protein